MSAPSLPPIGPDWKVWAQQLTRALLRGLVTLNFKSAGDIPSENGIILWDEQNGYPVVSKDGVWEPVILEDQMSFEIRQAERVTFATYGVNVSVKDKAKNLNKFGSNVVVGTTFETIAQFQGTVANETFVSTNIIDSIVSSNVADTQTITIEGHTIDGSGNLTFVAQDATLNGQTEVTLATPLARANRAFVKASGVFNSPPAALAGTVSVYDNTGGITAGVPNVAAATKLLISAGETQSQKAATAISKDDFWFVSYIDASVGDAGGSANRVTVRLETRDVFNGGPWRPIGRDVNLNVGNGGETIFLAPYLIVPRNHDIRVVARADSNTIAIDAEVGGYLASIVT